MAKYTPCYKCKERSDLCHSTCQRYKDFQLELQHEKELRKKESEMENYIVIATIRRKGK